MKKNYHIILILVLSLLCCGILTGCGQSVEISKQGKIHDFKEFTAFTLDNEIFTQDNFVDYDITVIMFWAPWSDVSVYETGTVGTFIKTLPDNIQFVTVCFDGTEKTVKEALTQGGIKKATTLMNGDKAFKTICDDIANVPTTVFVDDTGEILGKPVIGAQENTEDFYLSEINKRLKKMHKDVIDKPEEETEQKNSTKKNEE